MNKLFSLLSALSLNAWAHEGHGIESASHYHATDVWGFIGVVTVATLLWWLSGRGK